MGGEDEGKAWLEGAQLGQVQEVNPVPHSPFILLSIQGCAQSLWEALGSGLSDGSGGCSDRAPTREWKPICHCSKTCRVSQQKDSL